MKEVKNKKRISIICCLIGFVLSLFGLLVGLASLGADGLQRIGIIFIMPSIFAFIIILLDFLIAIDVIKIGLIYSWISTIIKILIIILFIPNTIYNLKYELQFGVSNFGFDLILIVLLFIITIPSVVNIIKFRSLKNEIEYTE
ncbi:MAG: hypothetical protein IKG40_00255 [Bacilli bacterium]|nr:hypothetical protein [Bacilli bacterium]